MTAVAREFALRVVTRFDEISEAEIISRNAKHCNPLHRIAEPFGRRYASASLVSVPVLSSHGHQSLLCWNAPSKAMFQEFSVTRAADRRPARQVLNRPWPRRRGWQRSFAFAPVIALSCSRTGQLPQTLFLQLPGVKAIVCQTYGLGEAGDLTPLADERSEASARRVR